MVINQELGSRAEIEQGFAAFRYARLRFEAQAETAIDLPVFAGPVLRGGLGYRLRDLVCIHKERECGGCLLERTCAYATAFHAPQEGNAIKRALDLPPPFVTEFPMSAQPHLRAGERFEFGLTMFGRGLKSLPYFLLAIERLGALGFGPGRGSFSLIKIEANHDSQPVRAVFIKEDGYRDPDKLPLASGAACWRRYSGAAGLRRVQLDVTTPLQIKSRQCRASEVPALEVLAQSLLRRLSLVSQFHCGVEIKSPHFELVRQAAQATVAASEVRSRVWWRFSRRQQDEIRMSGFVGRLVYAGVPALLLPYLALGELTHVGKSASFGMGCYRMTDLGQDEADAKDGKRG